MDGAFGLSISTLPGWSVTYPLKRKKAMDKINLNTANRIPDELREILEQAPIWWTIGALFDYFDRNVSIDEIRRDWEQYKANQDENE